MPLPQNLFLNIVAKGEITHAEQYLLLAQCFQIYSLIVLSFIERFHIFELISSTSSAADLLYVGKDYPYVMGLILNTVEQW